MGFRGLGFMGWYTFRASICGRNPKLPLNRSTFRGLGVGGVYIRFLVRTSGLRVLVLWFGVYSLRVQI